MLIILTLFWLRGVSGLKFNITIVFTAIIIIQSFFLKKWTILFYSLKVALVVIFLFEIVGSRINNTALIRKVQDNYFLMDSVQGYRFAPNTLGAKSALLVDDRVVYSVYYSSDEFGRRICSNSDIASLNKKNKHVVFLGCSFTFGEGLDCEYSIPYLIQGKDAKLNTYNYAFRGYGPHNDLLNFQPGLNIINKDIIQEKEGYAIYTYIDDHLNRVYGGGEYLAYGHDTPDIFIEDDSVQIRKRGSFNTWLALNIFNKSEILKLFKINITYPKTEEYYKRFAEIINYTSSLYHREFPQGKFCVVIYPNQDKDLTWVKYLSDNIFFLHPESPVDYDTNLEAYILDTIYDNHPTRIMNEYYSNIIYQSILSLD